MQILTEKEAVRLGFVRKRRIPGGYGIMGMNHWISPDQHRMTSLPSFVDSVCPLCCEYSNGGDVHKECADREQFLANGASGGKPGADTT